jgi:hypothetical protein
MRELAGKWGLGGLDKVLGVRDWVDFSNPMMHMVVESHRSAESALGWGTRLRYGREGKRKVPPLRFAAVGMIHEVGLGATEF